MHMDCNTHGRRVAETILTIVFLTTLGLFFFGTIFSDKPDISAYEKRKLASFPQFSLTAPALIEWSKSLTRYLEDHFYQRENLVYLNALFRIKVFQRSPNFTVLAGEDGWYFFIGDWALHDFLRRPEKADAELTRSWEELIDRRQQMLQALGTNYLVAVVPNKESLYPEFLPKRIREKAGTPILQVMSTRMQRSPMANHFLDLQEHLRLAKSNKRLFCKTDSHWNARGAYFAYRAIMERIMLWHPEIAPLPENSFEKRQIEISPAGDLIMLMGLLDAIPEQDEDWIPQHPCPTLEDRTITSEMLPPGRSLKANGCSAGVDLRVLVISDSFGEEIRKYFSATFKEVVYSREVGVSELQSFIRKYRFDIVLDLNVARCFPLVMSPGDDE